MRFAVRQPAAVGRLFLCLFFSTVSASIIDASLTVMIQSKESQFHERAAQMKKIPPVSLSIFLSLFVLLAMFASPAAFAQNVLLPSSATSAPKSGKAIVPAPVAPTPAPATAAAAPAPLPLPSTPIPQPSKAPAANGLVMPQAQLNGIVAMQKNALVAMGQASTQIQQQIAAGDAELQRNPPPDRRAQLLQEKQMLMQSLARTNGDMQRIQSRIGAMQGGAVSMSDMSVLFSQ